MTVPRYVLTKLHTGMLFCPQRSAGMVDERPRSAGMAYRLTPSYFEHCMSYVVKPMRFDIGSIKRNIFF